MEENCYLLARVCPRKRKDNNEKEIKRQEKTEKEPNCNAAQAGAVCLLRV